MFSLIGISCQIPLPHPEQPDKFLVNWLIRGSTESIHPTGLTSSFRGAIFIVASSLSIAVVSAVVQVAPVRP